MFLGVSFVVVLAMLLSSFLVLNANSRDERNRYFAIFSTLTALWATVNTCSIYVQDSVRLNQFFTSLITPTSLIALHSFFLFSLNFPRKIPGFAYLKLVFVLLGAPVVLMSFTPLNIKLISVDPITYELGVLYPVFVSLTVILGISGISMFVQSFRRSVGKERLQLTYIFYGLVLSVVLGLITGVALPAFGVTKLWNYSHLFTIFFVGSVSYAILKLRVFDVRLLGLRALAYVISVVVVSLLTVAIVIFIGGQTYETGITTSQLIVFGIVVAVIVPTFGVVRKYFDRITNRIFYRHAYDFESAVSDLNRNLVHVRSIPELVESFIASIDNSIRPMHTAVMVNNRAKKKSIEWYGYDFNLTIEEISRLKKSDKDYLLIKSELNRSWKLRFMSKKDIEVIISLHEGEQCLGYVFLGRRMNGGSYSERDKVLLTIAKEEFSLALSNTLKYETIALFNNRLSKKIDHATRALRLSNAQLRRLNEIQHDFISATSHQLKPQLMAASGFIGMLEKDKKIYTHSDQELFSLLEKSIKRMERIVSGILEPSLVSDNATNLRLETVDIVALLKEEINDLQLKADTKGIQLHFLSDDESVTVRGDKIKLREVFFNLIDNAVAYSHSNSHVTVQVLSQKKFYQIQVEDEAPHINDEEAQKVFEKYYRSKEAKKIRPVGTGIGLYVTKMFIEMHAGTVTVSQYKKGNRFTVRLPK